MALNQVINLLDAAKEERQRFLDSFDLILTDCDGTVWNMHSPIDGAGAGAQALTAKGKRIVYCSNNATRTPDKYNEKFAASRISATFDDVMHPGVAAIDYLKQKNFKGLIYLIGMQPLKQLLETAGYEIYVETKDLIEENYAVMAKIVDDEQPVRAVIMDWDYNMAVKELMKAHVYLMNADCEFILCGMDMIFPHKTPLMGPGHIYKMMERVTGRTGIVVGKPGKQLKDIVLKKYNVTEPGRVLFIGDSLEADVGFGKICGFQTLAVLTGSATETAILTHTNKNEVPDYILTSFADFAVLCKDLS